MYVPELRAWLVEFRQIDRSQASVDALYAAEETRCGNAPIVSKAIWQGVEQIVLRRCPVEPDLTFEKATPADEAGVRVLWVRVIHELNDDL